MAYAPPARTQGAASDAGNAEPRGTADAKEGGADREDPSSQVPQNDIWEGGAADMKRIGEDGYTACHRRCRSVELAPEVCVNLKKWIGWVEFTALPPTLQKVYAQYQVDTYRVGISVLATAWHKSEPTVRALFLALEIQLPPGTRKADKLRFLEFTRGESYDTAKRSGTEDLS